jgi:hypothetical protein
MSYLSYGLLFVVSNLNFWYPALGCITLGLIPPSMQGFREQWSLRVQTTGDRRTIRALRVTGIRASGLWIMSYPMFLRNVDDSLNCIITTLLSY